MLSEQERNRYSKHILIDKFGEAGQEKLKKSRVLVVGAGGLGSPILYYLIAAGVGKIGIVDADKVDISNLQRQILYNEYDVGKNKVDSAKEKLSQLNKNVDIHIYNERLNENNAEAIINEYEIVIDAVDNKQTRYIIHEECDKQKKIVIEGAVSRLEGFFFVSTPKKTIPYNVLFPKDDKLESVDGSIGIIGAIAGIIGSIMALETIKILIGIESEYTNKILVFDGENLTFKQIKINSVE